MKLAEKCNTAASYVGEIEIGRKFPSIEMIEKIARALEVDAYRLFVDETTRNINNEKAAAFFAELPPDARQGLIGGIMDAVNDGLLKTLKSGNESPGEAQKSLGRGKGERPEIPRKRKK